MQSVQAGHTYATTHVMGMRSYTRSPCIRHLFAFVGKANMLLYSLLRGWCDCCVVCSGLHGHEVWLVLAVLSMSLYVVSCGADVT